MWHGNQSRAATTRAGPFPSRLRGLLFPAEAPASGVPLSMFKYPTRDWMALRDLDGPERHSSPFPLRQNEPLLGGEWGDVILGGRSAGGRHCACPGRVKRDQEPL